MNPDRTAASLSILLAAFALGCDSRPAADSRTDSSAPTLGRNAPDSSWIPINRPTLIA